MPTVPKWVYVILGIILLIICVLVIFYGLRDTIFNL